MSPTSLWDGYAIRLLFTFLNSQNYLSDLLIWSLQKENSSCYALDPISHGPDFLPLTPAFPQHSCRLSWRYSGVTHKYVRKDSKIFQIRISDHYPLEKKKKNIYVCLNFSFESQFLKQENVFNSSDSKRRECWLNLLAFLCAYFTFTFWHTINKKWTDNSRVWRHHIIVTVFLQIWSTHAA